jgi:phenylacetate-CoA ligase
LEEGFGAPVRDGYGMAEFGTIAVQCDRGAYHVESERLLVEVVDADGSVLPAGERGELVVTDLMNRAMPLIRYRTGDHGSLAEGWCDCGHPGDLLTGFTGRDHGTLTFGSGLRVPVIALTRVVRLHPLRRFQIVRRAIDELEILLLPRTGGPDADVAAAVAADVKAFVDGAATVTARLVGADGFLADDRAKSTDFVSLAEQEGGGTS